MIFELASEEEYEAFEKEHEWYEHRGDQIREGQRLDPRLDDIPEVEDE